MRDVTPVTSSKVKTIVLCTKDDCDREITWNHAKRRYGSIGRVRANRRRLSGAEIRGMILHRLEEAARDSDRSVQPRQVNQQINSNGGQN